MIDLPATYFRETGKQTTSSSFEGYVYFTPDYVRWLEERVKSLITMTGDYEKELKVYKYQVEDKHFIAI